MNRRDDPVYSSAVDIEMGHQSNWRVLPADQDLPFLQMHAQGLQVPLLRLNEYHVGEALDRQPFNAAQALGKLPCAVMIIR
jgi:hypothetical protein